MGDRYRKLGTRRKAGRTLVYYQDKLTGDVFAITTQRG